MLPIPLETNGGEFYGPMELAKMLNKDMVTEFDLMAIQAEIHKKTRKTCKIEEGGIRILHDSEASIYNNSLFGRFLNAMFARNRKMLQVDRTQLTDDEQKTHDRKVYVQGKVLQAIRPVVKKYNTLDITDKRLPKRF